MFSKSWSGRFPLELLETGNIRLELVDAVQGQIALRCQRSASYLFEQGLTCFSLAQIQLLQHLQAHSLKWPQENSSHGIARHAFHRGCSFRQRSFRLLRVSSNSVSRHCLLDSPTR